MMRFGVCCSLENAPVALDAGADYVELAGWRLPGDADYRSALRNLPVEATNLFFPGDLAIYEDENLALEHGNALIRHAAELGVQVTVVGSGNARKSRPPMAREEANRRFVELMSRLAPAAAAGNLHLAPESLNREETDVGNDLAAFAPALKRAGVAFTADSYHILREWAEEGREGGASTPSVEHWQAQIPFLPVHVHLAGLERRPPVAEDPMLQGFAKRLDDLGYRSRVSIECGWGDFAAEIGPALKAVRALWRDASP